MTIHTKWMELLRTEAVDAFEYGSLNSASVKASFIDGQIKLMKSESTQTWSDLLYSKFTSVIMRHFVEFGCTTVVLAFDDKRYVPRAKAITQLKRRVGVNLLPFSETDVLPSMLPVEWKEAIMSPWFKHRVIELICTNIPRLVSPPDGCKLIVDWETVTEYVYQQQQEAPPNENGEPGNATVLPQDTDIGEADLKFTRWMRSLQCPMLIEATDGDYIPISLGLRAAGFHHPIVILKAWTLERGSEFINMDKLHTFLRDRMAAACRRTGRRPQCDDWEIKLFITILGLCGTDFTRNLPLISPQKIWASMPLIIQTFQMESNARIHVDQGKRIVELLYAEAFPKHIDSFSRRSVWSQAQVMRCGYEFKGQKLTSTHRPPSWDSATRLSSQRMHASCAPCVTSTSSLPTGWSSRHRVRCRTLASGSMSTERW